MHEAIIEYVVASTAPPLAGAARASDALGSAATSYVTHWLRTCTAAPYSICVAPTRFDLLAQRIWPATFLLIDFFRQRPGELLCV